MIDRERFGALLSGVRFGQFVSVGIVGAAADTAVLMVFRLVFGAPELLAKAAGVETAILVMFAVNEVWTFADEGAMDPRSLATRIAKSHLVRSGGVTVQLTVYTVLTQIMAVEVVLAGTDWWFLLASPIAIAAAMGVNYVFESLFTWQVHREDVSDTVASTDPSESDRRFSIRD
ncbi:GtrA family protein [Halococcoides cellulosivorans]|uniref:Sugar translocase n=1 Tax=Halococcoides cellulosivorans TaxID=1679096 RepID=A0A2R4X2W9_9EURY|nr:GtrA family protein [Halococcoides cellulosivorans]AWB28043.1 sugar translocase [Halococcoides cellulosivorans]